MHIQYTIIVLYVMPYTVLYIAFINQKANQFTRIIIINYEIHIDYYLHTYTHAYIHAVTCALHT